MLPGLEALPGKGQAAHYPPHVMLGKSETRAPNPCFRPVER